MIHCVFIDCVPGHSRENLLWFVLINTLTFFFLRSMFDTFSKPANLSYDYPSISILNNNADILLHGMSIQTIVIESPIRTKEILERIATRADMEKKVEGSDLPEVSLKEIEKYA